MDTVTAFLEAHPWLTVLVGMVLGSVLGSGSIWSFLRYRAAKYEHELNAAKVISQLRKELFDWLVLLIERSEQYANVRDGIVQAPIPGNELLNLQAQIDLLKADISAGELRLAKLEGRQPRSINLSYVRPTPPTGLRVIVD